MSKITRGEWEHRVPTSGIAIIGRAGQLESPPNHVVSVYVDDQRRRCTAFVAICNSTTLDNEANARAIAKVPEAYGDNGLVRRLAASFTRTKLDEHDEPTNLTELACQLIEFAAEARALIAEVDHGK